EQDGGAITQAELSSGATQKLYSGLSSPFYLAWDRTGHGLLCVQRDPANSLVRLDLGPPVALATVATGLAWRPSGVAPNADDSLIYICSDRELEVISFNGAPPAKPAKPPFEVQSIQFDYREYSISIKHHETNARVRVP